MDRGALVRRNTILLACAHGVAQVGIPVLLVLGLPEAARLTGHDWASGLVWAISFVAAAGGALLIGRWMDRVGRRPGLRLAYIAIAVGGFAGALSIRAGLFAGLLVSAVASGIGSGGANLARGAVADMYSPSSRGRAVGILIAAGVVGAVGGPLLIPLAEDAAGAIGADPALLPWVLPVVGGAFALVMTAFVRTDPRDLAHQDEGEVGTVELARKPRELLAIPAFRSAILAALIAQMAMVSVMGVTPNALEHRGHGADVPWIISVHVAGMFALAPLIGSLLDRWGHRRGMFAGLAISLAGALAASAGTSTALVAAGLFAIGLGWSAAFLAATAVISDATRADERAGALGSTDLVVLVGSATAALVGGFGLDIVGYRGVGLGAAAVVILTIAALLRMAGKVPGYAGAGGSRSSNPTPS